MIKPLKKKRRPRTKNLYFTKVHEEAIVQYAKSDCIKEKTKLYVTLIQPAFNQMVDKIVYTYRFTTLPNIGYLKDDCKIWLTTILGKFDPDKGYKAFSYFSVVTKNWFIQEVKRTQKRNRTEIFMEDMKSSTGTELRDRREFGAIAAKYVENLQRSNEQMVKLATILQKQKQEQFGLTEDDKDQLFDLLKEDKLDAES